jgi:hypothetical protein
MLDHCRDRLVLIAVWVCVSAGVVGVFLVIDALHAARDRRFWDAAFLFTALCGVYMLGTQFALHGHWTRFVEFCWASLVLVAVFGCIAFASPFPPSAAFLMLAPPAMAFAEINAWHERRAAR